MSSKIYLYRRKGNSEWATCDPYRFVELSSHKLFDTKTCYEAPPELAELQATIARQAAEIERLNDELSACTTTPGGCSYWRESSRLLTQENERLKGGQGEPVAVCRLWNEGCSGERLSVEWISNPCSDGALLYASQPAPVSPELVQLLERAKVYARGPFLDEINACLDKIKELNQ